MPSQKRNSKAEPKACATHMRISCPICKGVRNGSIASQPIAATRGEWVTVGAKDNPRTVQRNTGTCSQCGKPAHSETHSSPTRSTPRKTTPNRPNGNAQVSASDVIGAGQASRKRSNSAPAKGHPEFVSYARKYGKTFGFTKNGAVYSKDSTPGSKWTLIDTGSRSRSNGVSYRKPSDGEFYTKADSVIGIKVPRAGTVGTVNRSPFQHRI